MWKKFDLMTAIFKALLMILGFVCYKLYSSLEKLEEAKQHEIDFLDEKLRQDESIIDSLEKCISLRESIIDSLSFFREEISQEKYIVVEEVRVLPLTEGVEFLRENLKEYEEFFEIDSIFGDDILFWEY